MELLDDRTVLGGDRHDCVVSSPALLLSGEQQAERAVVALLDMKEAEVCELEVHRIGARTVGRGRKGFETPKAEWERAVLVGFEAWHHLRDNNGGVVTIDSANRTLTFQVS